MMNWIGLDFYPVGRSTLADLQQVLEDYLPVLLRFVEKGNQLQNKLQFSWVNQEDDPEVRLTSSSRIELKIQTVDFYGFCFS